MRFWTDTADVPGDPILVRARKLTALAAAVLAVAGLSACRSNVGAAAVVDGRRITESDVHSYLTPQGPSVAGLAKFVGLVPQSVALNTVVQERVFALTLSRTAGGLPSDAELRAQHDQAAATLVQPGPQGPITGAQYDSGVAASLGGYGLSQRLLPFVVRVLDLEYALVTRTKATTGADVARAIAAQHIPVSVNPAYGTWSTTAFSVAPPTFSAAPPTTAAGTTVPCPNISTACPSGFLILPSAPPSAAPTG
jgi:hypothetical protein